ncbi:LysR family transcriptional regulator [Providencia sp. PROV188]|jgi:DNA-binding transcriptional LysR family regulator|uniref:LysR family transcriptional regulator n=2 Tax=Morganellaceae TaxID=1903414 RepID=UPI0003E21C2F|nr:MULTISPECIES: LysR family transcriptional regulator [Providencia]MTC44580.1 LysR family transcriptional regulator [Providencia sp. wls1922]WBM62501.1 LysR family transcriptional regulator [Providencia sp. PROV188]ETT03423.1 LysR substrate-binding domain protein [Providencia alcalifaciens PAL-3]EUD01333.1 LysR substrate-binding domain protein [Providencia alcalifaciens PAL-1]MDR2243738.1 LysR family transcriptional regulator [Providencia alcalifaciens]
MQRYFDDMQMGSIELFCLTVETGSFTAAANAAGVTPAAVSRSVGRLEKRLQARLFVRTTRSMRTTDTGQQYYLDCRNALNQLIEAESKISGEHQIPVGILRISVPTLYAHYRLLPRLNQFCSRYPQLKINLEVSNENIDFSEDNYDVAIRGSELHDSGLIARRLEDAELIIVAAPSYLQQHSTPHALSDLMHHECIQYSLPSSGRKIPWTFRSQGNVVKIETTGRLLCQQDFLATLTLVKNGAGLMQVYRFTVEQELQRGELVEVLQEYAGTTRPFILIYPYARYIPLKTKKFIEFMTSNGK